MDERKRMTSKDTLPLDDPLGIASTDDHGGRLPALAPPSAQRRVFAHRCLVPDPHFATTREHRSGLITHGPLFSS